MPTKFYLKESDALTGPFTSKELEARYRVHEVDGDTLAQMNLLFGGQWEPLRRYFPHFLSGHRAAEEPAHGARQWPADDEPREGGRPRHDVLEETSVKIRCVKCGALFTLELLDQGYIRYCPACQTEYQSVHAAKEPHVFLVIPLSPQTKTAPCAKHLPRENLTAQVLEALSILECSPEESLAEVRKAYHKKIKEYHPDRVVDLGKELRKVAELKTIELTTAYQVLQRAYTAA